MTTTLKINDETKSRFDKLQARILVETGKKMTQQEILELLLEHAEKDEEEIIIKLSGIKFPPTMKEQERILSLQIDFGIDTAKVAEDKIIYEDS